MARDAYVADADGGEPARLTADTLDDSYPRWSADGRRVYFGRARGTPMTSALGADGRWGPAERAADLAAPGFWTADGRHLVFARQDTLLARDARGAARTVLPAGQLGGRIVSFALGPDPAIAYVRVEEAGGAHAFHAVPIAGGAARRPSRIIFSTDGRWLYFTMIEAESDLWVMSLGR